MNSGTLYVVSTPIGNRDDITLRALEVLKQVEWVAAEDTRHTGQLLKHYGISAKLISNYDQNERSRAGELVELLKNGESVAIVSDAGTPTISDPGFHAVKTVSEAGLPVVPIPGASSVLAAVLVLALVREYRLRRALQTLLRRLLIYWRSHETNDDADSSGRRPSHDERL